MAQVGSRGERLDLIVRQESTLGLLSVFICSVSWTFLQEWYARELHMLPLVSTLQLSGLSSPLQRQQVAVLVLHCCKYGVQKIAA